MEVMEALSDVISIINRWWWGGDPDAKNEVSGLSLRDVYNVQKSWKKIQKNSIENGMLMLLRLFHMKPEAKLLFKNLAHLHSDEEIAANMEFRAQTLNIMSALNNTIVNLNNPELVVALMQKLGNLHQRQNVEKKYFWVFKDILVNTLRNDLKFSEDVLESWNRCLTFMYDHMLPRLSS